MPNTNCNQCLMHKFDTIQIKPLSTIIIVRNNHFSAATAKRQHPFPSRTRKLSSSAPMVLHGKLCGRVGRRRIFLTRNQILIPGFYFRSHNLLWRALFFLDIIGRDETFSEHGFRVSGVSPAGGQKNGQSDLRRNWWTSNVEHRTLNVQSTRGGL